MKRRERQLVCRCGNVYDTARGLGVHERRFCVMRKKGGRRGDKVSQEGKEEEKEMQELEEDTYREEALEHYFTQNGAFDPGISSDLPDTVAGGVALKYYKIFQAKAMAMEEIKEKETVLAPARKAELTFLAMAKKWYVIAHNRLYFSYQRLRIAYHRLRLTNPLNFL